MCTKQVQEPQGARCGSAVAVVTEGQNRQRGQGRPWPASVGHLAVKCGLTQVRAFGAWQHGHKHFSSSMLTPGQGCIPDQRRGSARPQRGNGLHPRDTHFDRRRTWTKSARRPRSCGAKATSSSDQEPSLHGIVTGHAPDKIIEHGGLRRSVCGGVATRSSVHPLVSTRICGRASLLGPKDFRISEFPVAPLGQDLDHASQGGGCRRCTCSGDWPRRGAE